MREDRALLFVFLVLGILGVISVSAISFPDYMTHISRSFPSTIQNSEKYTEFNEVAHQVISPEKKFGSEFYTFFGFEGGNLIRFQEHTEPLSVSESDLDYTINPFKANYTFGLIYEIRNLFYRDGSLFTIYFFRLLPFLLVAVYIFYLLIKTHKRNRLNLLIIVVHLTNPIFVWLFTSLHPITWAICGFILISLKLYTIEIEKELHKPTKVSIFIQASAGVLIAFISGRISVVYFMLLFWYFFIILQNNKLFKDSKSIASKLKTTSTLPAWKKYLSNLTRAHFILVFSIFLTIFLGLQIRRATAYWSNQSLKSYLINLVNVLDGFETLIGGVFAGNVNFENRSFFANYNSYLSKNVVNFAVWIAALASLSMLYFNLKNGSIKIAVLKVVILALVALPTIVYKSLTFDRFNIQYHHLVFLYLFWLIFNIPKQMNRVQREVLATIHFIFLPIYALQWMQLLGTYQDSTLEKLGVTNAASQSLIEGYVWHLPFVSIIVLGAYFVLVISFLRELLKR